MKRPKGKGREVLTLSVVQTAQAGDAEAMNCILRYYACVLLEKHTVKRDDCFGGVACVDFNVLGNLAELVRKLPLIIGFHIPVFLLGDFPVFPILIHPTASAARRKFSRRRRRKKVIRTPCTRGGKQEHLRHNAFANRRVNMVNGRKEFFRVSLEEIAEVVRKNHDKTVEFKNIAIAQQYRKTLKMQQQVQEKAANRSV